jgi:hypothetical protein
MTESPIISRLIKIAFVVAMVWAAYGIFADRAVSQPDGVLVKDVPDQRELSDREKATGITFKKGDYTIKALARFEFSARVLSKERYRYDAGASLVPYDIAFGWRAMSDNNVLKQLKLSQSGRFYFWSAAQLPTPADELSRSAANMHLIAANDTVAKQIAKLRPGQIASLRGYLVDVAGANGFTWKSSLTREDTGGGACEVIWVEAVSVQ